MIDHHDAAPAGALKLARGSLSSLPGGGLGRGFDLGGGGGGWLFWLRVQP